MRKIVFLLFPLLLMAGGKVWVPIEWDSSSIREFKGVILSIRRNIADFESEGIQYELHLGPATYLRKHGIRIAEGSKIWVRGMVIKVEGRYYIFSQRIKASGKELNIRDKDGFPMWKIIRRKKIR